MSYVREFDDAARVAVVRAAGAVTLESSVAAVRDLAGDPRLSPGYAILVDMRAAEYRPTLADAARLGQFEAEAEAVRGFPMAFVTPGGALHAAATMLAAMAGARGLVARAFQELEQASAWLETVRPG